MVLCNHILSILISNVNWDLRQKKFLDMRSVHDKLFHIIYLSYFIIVIKGIFFRNWFVSPKSYLGILLSHTFFMLILGLFFDFRSENNTRKNLKFQKVNIIKRIK